MRLDKVLKLGNPQLHEVSDELLVTEKDLAQQITQELHEVLTAFQSRHKIGRAIAAPQIGYKKRLIYMHIDQPVVFINPTLYEKSTEMIELWDDCLSFPNLLVKLRRHKRLKIDFLDLNWQKHTLELEDDLAELLQHEYDHLDGILATQRAIDHKALAWRDF